MTIFHSQPRSRNSSFQTSRAARLPDSVARFVLRTRRLVLDPQHLGAVELRARQRRLLAVRRRQQHAVGACASLAKYHAPRWRSSTGRRRGSKRCHGSRTDATSLTFAAISTWRSHWVGRRRRCTALVRRVLRPRAVASRRTECRAHSAVAVPTPDRGGGRRSRVAHQPSFRSWIPARLSSPPILARSCRE